MRNPVNTVTLPAYPHQQGQFAADDRREINAVPASAG